MGQKSAREKFVADEFSNLINSKKSQNLSRREYTVRKNGVEVEYLTLSDIQAFKQPRNRDIMLDMNHLGTLFVLDQSKDGRFYLQDLQAFADLYFERQASNPNVVDVVKEFQSFCTINLWNSVMSPNGRDRFVKWFGRLFSLGHMTSRHDRSGQVHVDRGAVKLLDDVLNVYKTFGIEHTYHFSLIQAVAKQNNTGELKSRYKDLIPRDTLEFIGSEFIDGFIKYMTDLGFEPGMEIH